MHCGGLTVSEDTAGLYDEPPVGEAHLYKFNEELGKWQFTGGGDLNSEAKGSGVRYNKGKPPMHYIPFEQQLTVLQKHWREECDSVFLVLEYLAKFERRQVDIDALLTSLQVSDLEAAAYVWDHGARKYSAWNWAKGMAWSIPLGCISRHAKSIIVDREEIDPESGCSHWGHIVCNLLMLDHYRRYYRAGDDRPPATVFEEG